MSATGGGSSGPVDCTYTDSAVSSSNLTTYTFSGRSLGSAADDRYILVCAFALGLSARTLSSVTIGGINATTILTASDDDGFTYVSTAMVIAKVPTGTTGDIVVTWSGGLSGCGIGVYRLTNLESATPTATASDVIPSSNALSASLTIPVDGCGVGYAAQYNYTAARTWIWANLTENFDGIIETYGTHSGAISTTAGTANRTATASGTTVTEILLLAAFR